MKASDKCAKVGQSTLAASALLVIRVLLTSPSIFSKPTIASICKRKSIACVKIWRCGGHQGCCAHEYQRHTRAWSQLKQRCWSIHGSPLFMAIFQVSQVEIRVAKLGWGQWLQYIHSGLCNEDWISTSQYEPGLWRPADVKDVCGPSVATLQGEEKACPQAARKAPLASIRPDCLRNVAPFLLFIFPMLRISHKIPTCHEWTGYNSTRNMKAKSNSNILTKQGEKRSKA